MSEALHPILQEKGIQAGTPDAVLAVAGYFVRLRYEDNPKNKDNIFGKWFGINHTAWCAQFVSYCFTKGGAGYVVQNTQMKKGFISCTAGIKAFKKKRFKFVPVHEAQKGDIIFFDWDHNHDPDHVEIVVKNNPKKKIVVCRGGNTSRGDGSRSNGGQVAERSRNYSSVFCVVRPEWRIVEAPKPVEVAKPEVVATPLPIPEAVKPIVAPQPQPAPIKKPEAQPAKTYKVRRGDSYWSIAEAHKLDYKKLQKLNGNKKLIAGTILKLG